MVGVALSVGRFADSFGANGIIIGLGVAQLALLWIEVNARAFGLPKPEWTGKAGLGILLGIAAAVCAVALQSFWGWALAWMGVEVVEQRMVSVLRLMGGANLGALIIMSGLVGPIIEEVYFRFWWLDWLRKRLTAMEASLWVALVFALFHGDGVTVPGLFVMGCFCAFARLRWGLVSAIACHSVFNLITIIAVRGGWF